MTRAYVAVGSNIDPLENVVRAVALLLERVEITGVSTFYRTLPLGPAGQPPFVNGVVRIETDLGAEDVKWTLLRPLEASLGRRRSADKFAPRTIDLDLILHGDLVVDTGRLRLPDPEIRERPFIALPLLELDPDLRFPGTGEPLSGIVARFGKVDLVPVPEVTRRMASTGTGRANAEA